jgi:hypothetical protein
LVVKKGWKIWARIFASIPCPVSVTASITYEPGSTPACTLVYGSSSSLFRVSIVSRPPSGIASRAFTTRFMITCSICEGSADAPEPRESTTISDPLRPLVRVRPSPTAALWSSSGLHELLGRGQSWRQAGRTVRRLDHLLDAWPCRVAFLDLPTHGSA